MIQEICAIIDRSGSMKNKEQDTIGGINSTIDELRKNKDLGELIYLTIKFFDHEEYVFLPKTPIENVNDLNLSDLIPRGQTALLDVMGNTLYYYIQKKKMDIYSFDSCIIYIATDGFENCSEKYDNITINNLIIEAEKLNIKLLYLAANQDAILEASKFGLDSTQAINYSERPETTESVYRAIATAAKRVRSGGNVSFLATERQASQK
tara:strand:+ start:53 stop:676 length:624 start_codon:yes stop_codon:yes gene_type:complete